ncbi:hypothetical protein RMATCC62417_01189 [Rhizopus microsporus]|nr:hypothetical protein RMATCC62417_01189 [Rhizopus microsporus]
MNRTLENAEVRERIIRFAKKLDIEPRTARRWRERSQKEKEVPYKLLEKNAGRKGFFTLEHKEYIQNLLDEGPQLYTEDIIDSLPRHFMGLSISKTQLNHRFEGQHIIKSYHCSPNNNKSTDYLALRPTERVAEKKVVKRLEAVK